MNSPKELKKDENVAPKERAVCWTRADAAGVRY